MRWALSALLCLLVSSLALAEEEPAPVEAPAEEAPSDEAPTSEAATEPPAPAAPASDASATPAPLRPIRVAVYQLKAAELDPQKIDLITNSLLAEVRKLTRVAAIGMDEIQAMLLVEEQKQMLGCSDESCVAEIAGALGADFLIMGSVGKVGESSVLGLKRVDMKTASTIKSFNKRMTGGSGEELLEALGPGVADLFPDYPLRVGLTRGVNSEVVQRWNPPPLDPWVFWTVAGTAVAALGTSGAFFLQKRAAEEDYRRLVDRSRSQQQPVAGADLVEAADRAELDRTVALALLGTGGGLAVLAAILAVFTDWQGELEVAPAVGQGVAGVTVSGRFPGRGKALITF